MDAIRLRINSMTHHAIAARREEFVATAVGREVTLVAQPCPKDVRCVGVFVDVLRVGNIHRDDALLAQRVLLGSGEGVATGRIVAVANDGFELLADLGELPLASVEEVNKALPLGLDAWATSVAALAPTVALPQEVETMEKLFWKYFKGNRVTSVVTVVDRLYEIMRYDLSGDMQSQRLMMHHALAGSDDELLQRAAERLSEAGQRMGGDHQMEEVGRWLRHELAKTHEAQCLLSGSGMDVTRAQVEREAQALPGDLYKLWLTDEAAFARVLYGMRLPRADVRRVMGCLLWLELKETDGECPFEVEGGMTYEQMADYCCQRVSWEEARPIVEMIRPEDAKAASRVEDHFRRRTSGYTYVEHQTVIPSVSNYQPHINNQSISVPAPSAGQQSTKMIED